MKAIYERELDSQFNGLTGYVYSALILLASGLFVLFVNVNSKTSFSSTQFEGVLYFMVNIFIPCIAIPIVTMRSIAEERHQKTDQLLYSLPISMTKIVIGKFLAIVTVIAVPVLVLCLYPLVLTTLATSGTIAYKAAYSALAAFFFLSVAYAAICMFISSLTENSALAVGISVTVGLALYFVKYLENVASSSAGASFIGLTVVVVLVGLIIWLMTKNITFATVFTAILEGALIVCYLIWHDSFTGLFMTVITQLAIFGRFDNFAADVFDITGLVYYITVAGIFLFLTVQAMEKRRWS